MSEPHVAGIIPVHNHRRWVGDAISSMCRQTHKNLSIVVVNDGSTDGSEGAVLLCMQNCYEVTNPGDEAAGIKRYAGSTKENNLALHLISRKEAKGPAAARNLGMSFATKETSFFAFLDSDDMYEPSKIEKSLARFQKNPLLGCVYSDFDTLSIDTGVKLRQWKQSFSREELLRECGINCDSVVSKAAMEFTGGFPSDMRTCEDYATWVFLSERFLISHIPESLVTIRVGKHSSTATVPNELWQQCYRKVFEKMRERAGQRA